VARLSICARREFMLAAYREYASNLNYRFG
jgi:hypothetical protein